MSSHNKLSFLRVQNSLESIQGLLLLVNNVNFLAVIDRSEGLDKFRNLIRPLRELRCTVMFCTVVVLWNPSIRHWSLVFGTSVDDTDRSAPITMFNRSD